MLLTALLVIGTALGSQLVARRVPINAPGTVMQLLAGLALGPSGVGLLHMDAAVGVLAASGMAYLLFAGGMELERRVHDGRVLRTALAGFGVSGILAGSSAVAISAITGVRDVPVVVVAVLTTLVMPTIAVLAATGRERSQLGNFTILSGALGEAGAIAVILASAMSGAPAVSAAILCLLAGAVATLRPSGPDKHAVEAGRGQRRIAGLVVASGPRLALCVIAALAGLVPLLGAEPLLVAFAAGLVWSSCHRSPASWARLRRGLDRPGLAVLAPMSFISAGARIDVAAVLHSPGDAVLVPTLLVAMVLCRALPARLCAPRTSDLRERHGAGLLLATKLTLVVVAVQLARAQGSLASGAGSALLLSAEITVCVFPAIAGVLLARRASPLRQNRLVLLDTNAPSALKTGNHIVKQHCTTELHGSSLTDCRDHPAIGNGAQ
ncbi:MAG: cation:proton antiporter [Solirubrobacteraceae bacterium]